MHSRYALNYTIYLLDQNIGLTSSFSLRSAKADTYYGDASLDTKKKKIARVSLLSKAVDALNVIVV